MFILYFFAFWQRKHLICYSSLELLSGSNLTLGQWDFAMLDLAVLTNNF